MNATPKVLQISNLDTTLQSNPRVSIYIGHSHLVRKRWSLIHSPTVLHGLLCSLDKTLHSTKQVCSHTHTYNCGGSGGAINIVGSNTHISESSAPIALKFWHNIAFQYGRPYMYVWNWYVAAKRWSLKQSRKLLHRLVSNFDTPLHSNTHVFIYGMGRDRMGCDGTGRDGMRQGQGGMGQEGTWWDGMGWNGMALSHSNAWPGTASDE
jgi:hypothetical protein